MRIKKIKCALVQKGRSYTCVCLTSDTPGTLGYRAYNVEVVWFGVCGLLWGDSVILLVYNEICFRFLHSVC